MDTSASLQAPDSNVRMNTPGYRPRRNNVADTSNFKIRLQPTDEQPVYRYDSSGKEIFEPKPKSRKDMLNDYVREHANRLCNRGDVVFNPATDNSAASSTELFDAGFHPRNTVLFSHLARKLRKSYSELAELTDMLNMCRPVEASTDADISRTTTAENSIFKSSTKKTSHAQPYFVAHLTSPTSTSAANTGLNGRNFASRPDPFAAVVPPGDEIQTNFALITRKKKTIFAVAATLSQAAASMRALMNNTNSEKSANPYPFADAGPFACENTRQIAQRAMKASMPFRSILNAIISTDDSKQIDVAEPIERAAATLQQYDYVRVPCSSPRFFYRFLLQLHKKFPLTSCTYRKRNSFISDENDSKITSRLSGAVKLSADDLPHQPSEAEILEITGLLGLTDPTSTIPGGGMHAVDHLSRYTLVYDNLRHNQQVGCYAPRFVPGGGTISDSLTPKTVRLVFEVINRDADERCQVALRAVVAHPLAQQTAHSPSGKPTKQAASQQVDSTRTPAPQVSIASSSKQQKQDAVKKQQQSSLPFANSNLQTDDAAAAAASAAALSGGGNMTKMQEILSFLRTKRDECFCTDSFRLLKRELSSTSTAAVIADETEVAQNYGIGKYPPTVVSADAIHVNLFASYVLRIKLEECDNWSLKQQQRQYGAKRRRATSFRHENSNNGIIDFDSNKPGALSMAISRALLAALMTPPPFLLSSRGLNAAGAVDFITSPVLRGKINPRQHRRGAAPAAAAVSGQLAKTTRNDTTASSRILQCMRQYLACQIKETFSVPISHSVRQCVDEVATLNAPDPQLVLRATSVCLNEGMDHSTAAIRPNVAAFAPSVNTAFSFDDAASNNTVFRLRCHTPGFDHLSVKNGAFIVTIRQLDVVFHTRDGWSRSCRADLRVSVLNTLNMCCARYNSQLLLVYFSGLGWPCSGIRLMQPVVCTDFTDESCLATPILTLPPAVDMSDMPPLNSSPGELMPPVATTISTILANDEEALYYDYFIQVQNPRKDLHVVMQISVDRPKRMAMFIRPPKCVAITIAREKARQQRKQGFEPTMLGDGMDLDEDDDLKESDDWTQIYRDWLNAPFIYPVCMFYDHVDNKRSTGGSSGYGKSALGDEGGAAGGRPETNPADPCDSAALDASDAATGRLQSRKRTWLDDADSIYESTLYYVALDQLFELIDIGTTRGRSEKKSDSAGMASLGETHEEEADESAVFRFAQHVMDRMRGIDQTYQSSSSFLNKLDLFISSPMINNLE